MNNDTLYNSIPKCFISKRLKYRLMELNDTDTVINLRNANHVRDNYIYQKPITVEEHINYYHTEIETGHIIQYVMVIPDNNKVIGCVFLKNIDFDVKTAEYGVFIGDIEELGKGYGTDAVAQMINIAFVIILAALAVAFAIAFGFGGRDFASHMLQKLEDKIDNK